LTPPGNGVSVQLFSGPKWPEKNDFWVLANDLEAVVFDQWPELKRFRDALLASGAHRALLSGSGSTVYGVYSGHDTLGAASRELRRGFPQWRMQVTRAIEGAAHVRGAGEE
jgi:4-diphosphocytidyl-2-C-methyl-D-erythritol kinase